jgi:hypothetical protein
MSHAKRAYAANGGCGEKDGTGLVITPEQYDHAQKQSSDILKKEAGSIGPEDLRGNFGQSKAAIIQESTYPYLISGLSGLLPVDHPRYLATVKATELQSAAPPHQLALPRSNRQSFDSASSIALLIFATTSAAASSGIDIRSRRSSVVKIPKKEFVQCVSARSASSSGIPHRSAK